ncbi:hypothetical protein LY76DRAFT_520429, partial [Colletotrichum caudatum]
KTYNTRYSLIVTDSTTNPALTGLSMGERTGSRVLQWVWPYVLVYFLELLHIASLCSKPKGNFMWLDLSISYTFFLFNLRARAAGSIKRELVPSTA